MLLRRSLEMLNPRLCLFLHSLLLTKPWTAVQREGTGVGGLTAGHMGRASSPPVCQPTWLLLWQTCPRQDHRLGSPVGLQQGSPASLSPLEHPSFHFCLGGPHPALQTSACRCHRSPFYFALLWNNSVAFYCLPCCVCNRSGLEASFFSLFLPCPQAARFQIMLLRGSGFQWCWVFLGNKSQKGLFTVTALMWSDC